MLQRFQNKYLRIIETHLDTLPMTLYIMISTCHTLEIKRLSQRYADRMKEHPNIVTNFMKEAKTIRRLKRKLPQNLCI